MVRIFSRKRPVFRHFSEARVVALLFLLGFSCSSLASDWPALVGVCEQCETEQEFARAAADRVPGSSPDEEAAAGSYAVYIARPDRRRIEFFYVFMGDNQDEMPAMFTRPGAYEFSPHKIAYRVDGSPEIKSAILDGVVAAMEFAEMLSGTLSTEDLDGRVASAIDLLGPEDSRASYARRQLIMDMNDHYLTDWSDREASPSDSLASSLMWQFVGKEAIVTLPETIEVKFEDDTSIEVRIDEIILEFGLDGDWDRSEFLLEMTVLQNTARLPDGQPVPPSANE